MSKPLIVNTLGVMELVKEFLPLDRTDKDEDAICKLYSHLEGFLSDGRLDIVCSDDCIYDVLASTLQVGYVAAQAGCDEVTLVTDDFAHWIMKGSSEKLLRDFTQYMKGVK